MGRREPENISQATMRPPLEYREVAKALSASFAIYFVSATLVHAEQGARTTVTCTQEMAAHATTGELAGCTLQENSDEVTLAAILDDSRPVASWRADLQAGPPWEIVHHFPRPTATKGIRTTFPKDALFECRVLCRTAEDPQAWRRLVGPVAASGRTVWEWDGPVAAISIKTVISRAAPLGNGLTYLSSLDPTEEKASFRKSGKDTNPYGQPIVIGGRRYTKGLGCHAHSELLFALDGKYGGFRADIGLNDTARRVR